MASIAYVRIPVADSDLQIVTTSGSVFEVHTPSRGSYLGPFFSIEEATVTAEWMRDNPLLAAAGAIPVADLRAEALRRQEEKP